MEVGRSLIYSCMRFKTIINVYLILQSEQNNYNVGGDIEERREEVIAVTIIQLLYSYFCVLYFLVML